MVTFYVGLHLGSSNFHCVCGGHRTFGMDLVSAAGDLILPEVCENAKADPPLVRGSVLTLTT